MKEFDEFRIPSIALEWEVGTTSDTIDVLMTLREFFGSMNAGGAAGRILPLSQFDVSAAAEAFRAQEERLFQVRVLPGRLIFSRDCVVLCS